MPDSMRHLVQGALALSFSAFAAALAAREFVEAHRSAILEGAAIVASIPTDTNVGTSGSTS